MKWLLVLAAVALLGCPPNPCTPLDTRCEGAEAQICDSWGRWVLQMDCTEAGVGQPGWACCPTDEGCTCLPAEECTP